MSHGLTITGNGTMRLNVGHLASAIEMGAVLLSCRAELAALPAEGTESLRSLVELMIDGLACMAVKQKPETVS